MAILVCESGADKRKVFPLNKPQMVCGRDDSADVTFNDPFASGSHFKIINKDHSWFVEDLKSSNGIEINDIHLPASMLRHGDLIKAGSTYLRFYERDETAEEASHEGLPRIDGYEIYERIGVGGMGEVYRACQLSLDREVAIKTLSAEHARDREFVDKFFSEARASGNLNHANIVQVHDVGETEVVCYICMEYVGGGDLTGKLRESEKLTQDEIIRISIEVARGLEYAESKGIVHCDIKPDNIMFTTNGMAKIADLGIARSVSGFQERRKEVFGSPHYMAPEQAMGKPVDHRADLYSLGCTMFRMLTGRTPFAGSTAREVMKKQVLEEHPDILKFAPDCSAELADVVDFLMEKKVADRCGSATELIRLLENILNKKKSKLKKNQRKQPALKAVKGAKGSVNRRTKNRLSKKKSNSSMFIFIGVIVAVIVGVAIYVIANRNPVEEAFKTVAALEANAEYSAAINELKVLMVLEKLSPTDTNRVESKISELEQVLVYREEELNFKRLWNSYLDLRQNGGSVAKLTMQIDYLASVFSDNKDFMSIISRERIRLQQLKKK